MSLLKRELIEKIEAARKLLDESIDNKMDYDQIYKRSIELDRWIAEYITAGY